MGYMYIEQYREFDDLLRAIKHIITWVLGRTENCIDGVVRISTGPKTGVRGVIMERSECVTYLERNNGYTKLMFSIMPN